MAVATGVNMTSKYVLPYMSGMKTVYSMAYRRNLSDEAKAKLRCYELHKYHGLKTSQLAEIFGKDKSTIYRWVAQVKKALQSRRYQFLEPKSKKPNKTPRDKKITAEVAECILDVRGIYKCGKDNIREYLKRDYGIEISSSTIGRYLNRLPKSKDPKYFDLNKSKTKRKKRKDLVRLKDVVDSLERRAFERFQIDTKYWVVNGKTFYVVAAIDVVTRMAFARAYTSHSSNAARDFLRKLDYVFDISNTQAYVQRDNGSEFMAKFEQEAHNLGVTLITNYVRCPQMNGFVESFNKTLKNECLRYNSPDTVSEANDILKNYIIQYNFLRLHGELGRETPFDRYLEISSLKPIEWIRKMLPSLSQMLWTYSISR